MDEPVLRAWMQEPVEPATFHAERPGHGREAVLPPPPRSRAEAFHWPSTRPRSRSPSTGLDCANSMGGGVVSDFHLIAVRDEASPRGRRTALRARASGFRQIHLTLAADQPNALVAARLCDVAPDGVSLLVTLGLLNLTHRDWPSDSLRSSPAELRRDCAPGRRDHAPASTGRHPVSSVATSGRCGHHRAAFRVTRVVSASQLVEQAEDSSSAFSEAKAPLSSSQLRQVTERTASRDLMGRSAE